MFNFYEDWKDFTVEACDWRKDVGRVAICANERHCTVANAAARILREQGWRDAETWVIALFNDADEIVGYRLTAKAYVNDAWRLFYWELGEKTRWVADQTDKQRELPPWTIVETLATVGTPKKSEIRGQMDPVEVEIRRVGIQVRRQVRAMMIAIGRDIARASKGEVPGSIFKIAEINARAAGLNLADCQKAYEKHVAAPVRKARRGGFGGRRRAHMDTAGQEYAGASAR
jgi:hypothetical protein